MTNKEIIIGLLDSIYPNKYDIQENSIIIKWDKIEVGNSRGNRHTIYDMYVKLKMNDSWNRLLRMEGARGLINFKEYESEYTFSHLSYNNFELSRFCVGTATPMSNFLSVLSTSEFTITLFEGFLYQLDVYLTWESIEGIPYRYISDIRYKNSNNSSYYRLDNLSTNNIFTLLNDTKDYIDIRVIPGSLTNSFKLITSFEFEKKLYKSFITNSYHDIIGASENNITYIKNIQNNTYHHVEECNDDNDNMKYIYKRYLSVINELPSRNPILSFKGERIRLKIIPMDSTNIKEGNIVHTNLVLKPYIYEYILNYIENRILTNKILMNINKIPNDREKELA